MDLQKKIVLGVIALLPLAVPASYVNGYFVNQDKVIDDQVSTLMGREYALLEQVAQLKQERDAAYNKLNITEESSSKLKMYFDKIVENNMQKKR